MKIKKIFLPVCFVLSFFLEAIGQQPFGVHIVPSSITSAPAVHSGAYAVRNGKWIFIGGRRDGVHAMQANTAFPAYNRNDSIYIVDPSANSCQVVSAQSLPPSIFGAICSANMQYFQSEGVLYMIGGYGWVDSISTWRTWPSLVAIDLDCLMSAVNTSSSITSCFTQTIDTNLAVSGGEVECIDSTVYLVFGHRFDGFYNRQNAGFTQHYTEAIRKFTIDRTGGSLSVANFMEILDTANFHRRDYNLLPQVMPDRTTGLTAFGGVFRKDANLPFFTPIDITISGYTVQQSFNQNLVQYTTAHLPLFDSTNNYMHSLFFGGISLYTLDTSGMTLVQDTLVPFVSTISKVSRDPSGVLTESKMNEEMPALLGTNGYFIADGPMYSANEHIMCLDRITGNQRIGYIVGGINSDLPNITDLDPVGMSRPNGTVYEVWIDKTLSFMDEIKLFNSINDVIVYPNPARRNVSLDFTIRKEDKITVQLYSLNGKLIRTLASDQSMSGSQHFRIPISNLSPGAYFFFIRSGSSSKAVRFIVQENE